MNVVTCSCSQFESQTIAFCHQVDTEMEPRAFPEGCLEPFHLEFQFGDLTDIPLTAKYENLSKI